MPDYVSVAGMAAKPEDLIGDILRFLDDPSPERRYEIVDAEPYWVRGEPVQIRLGLKPVDRCPGG